jgi:plasmid stabilization system protein ParE
MADKRAIFTENFSTNLTDIETFLGEEGWQFFHRFFEHLVGDIVPMLCRFPQSGRSFLDRSIRSTKALQLVDSLKGYLKEEDDLRELIVDDYLILYVVRGDRVVFLSVKHHRQLSFDLKRFWLE